VTGQVEGRPNICRNRGETAQPDKKGGESCPYLPKEKAEGCGEVTRKSRQQGQRSVREKGAALYWSKNSSFRNPSHKKGERMSLTKGKKGGGSIKEKDKPATQEKPSPRPKKRRKATVSKGGNGGKKRRKKKKNETRRDPLLKVSSRKIGH